MILKRSPQRWDVSRATPQLRAAAAADDDDASQQRPTARRAVFTITTDQTLIVAHSVVMPPGMLAFL
jgi:hypothetical protein